MSDVTQILAAIDNGDPAAAEQLLPLVYDELRKLAAARLAHERPGQTLQATALVHEAYVRLVAPHKATTSGRGSLNSELNPEGPAPQLSSLTPSPQPPGPAAFDSRGHFFAAAAEAMRRILVEAARGKGSLKRGGNFERVVLPAEIPQTESDAFDLLALDEALGQLEQEHPEKAQIIKLRFFAGLSLDEAAAAAGISRATAQRRWTYARAWLFGRLRSSE